MKKTMTVAVLLGAALMAGVTGCMSDAQTAQMASSYEKFITQERYMPLQSFEFGTNGNGTVSYTGLVRFTTYAPLDKLSIMPDNPGVARELVDGAVRVSGIAAAAYGVHELSNSGGKTTINNNAPAAP